MGQFRGLRGLLGLLADALWSAEQVAVRQLRHARAGRSSLVETGQERQSDLQSTCQGYPKHFRVTGDDSTMSKPKGCEGDGSPGPLMVGYRLAQGRASLPDCRSSVLQSTIERMETCMREAGADCRYAHVSAPQVLVLCYLSVEAADERDVLFSMDLTRNQRLCVPDEASGRR